MEGFNLNKTEADFAGVVGENGQEEVVVGVAKVEKESTLDKIIDNPEFLLNPNLMTNQGKAVFYTNLVVAGLILVAALLGKKVNAAVLMLILNVVIMAYLHSNVVNCMIVGNCNVYSTTLTVLNVLGQVLIISALVYLILKGRK